jgi:hypothetical protein
MDKKEREKLRELSENVVASFATLNADIITIAQLKLIAEMKPRKVLALLDHIDALEGQLEELKNQPNVNGGIYLCERHGGYGFVADCEKCRNEIQ